MTLRPFSLLMFEFFLGRSRVAYKGKSGKISASRIRHKKQ